MSESNIHLLPNRANKSVHLFLLLIPSIIFAVVVCLLFSRYEKTKIAATKENTMTLGKETVQP